MRWRNCRTRQPRAPCPTGSSTITFTKGCGVENCVWVSVVDVESCGKWLKASELFYMLVFLSGFGSITWLGAYTRPRKDGSFVGRVLYWINLFYELIDLSYLNFKTRIKYKSLNTSLHWIFVNEYYTNPWNWKWLNIY